MTYVTTLLLSNWLSAKLHKTPGIYLGCILLLFSEPYLYVVDEVVGVRIPNCRCACTQPIDARELCKNCRRWFWGQSIWFGCYGEEKPLYHCQAVQYVTTTQCNLQVLLTQIKYLQMFLRFLTSNSIWTFIFNYSFQSKNQDQLFTMMTNNDYQQCECVWKYYDWIIMHHASDSEAQSQLSFIIMHHATKIKN